MCILIGVLAAAGYGASGCVDEEGHTCGAESAQTESAAAAVESLVERLLQRLWHIFLGEGGAPRISRIDRERADAALEFICAADVDRLRFWKAHEAEVVRACGLSIDKQEVFAYLLADALGRPLLHREDARDVGQRGDNAAAKVKRVLKVTR